MHRKTHMNKYSALQCLSLWVHYMTIVVHLQSIDRASLCNTNITTVCCCCFFYNSSSLFCCFPTSLLLLHRCEWTGALRFLPSMPLAKQHHGATVPITGWILALALFLALQVKFCSDKIALSVVFFFFFFF